MKLLQNRLLVAVIAAVAVTMVGLNVLAPMRRTGRPARTPAAAPAVAKSAAPATNVPPQQPPEKALLQADTPLESDYALSRLREWIESPRCDPFEVYPKGVKTQTRNEVAAADVLRLEAVWRQTDRRLAVINKCVVAEGDTIGDYRLVKIEADMAWVEGPLGRERIEFAPAETTRSTNRPPRRR